MFQIILKNFLWLKGKNTLPWIYVDTDLKGEEIAEIFYRKKKKMQKTNQKEFSVEKVIKRKRDKLYIKWNGYDNYFNSWIDKKDIINQWIFSRNKSFSKGRESWIRFI